MSSFTFGAHLPSSDSLVTPYHQTRAGFVALALEKNRRASPYVEEAKALKVVATKLSSPRDLLNNNDLRASVLTAAGVSDKAAQYLTEEDKTEAIVGLIDNFLEPAGKDFADELVFRFLLVRGDSLGGRMRNLAGMLAEQKFSRALISALSISGRTFSWMHSQSRTWIQGQRDDATIELNLKALHWQSDRNDRVLLYNLTVPIVGKNVDLCLLSASPEAINLRKKTESKHSVAQAYIALGELKGGIDPAGADEHWKTANSALTRIRDAFEKVNAQPEMFFIGAAITKSMAGEIFAQLQNDQMRNAANLTDDEQLIAVCQWLLSL